MFFPVNVSEQAVASCDLNHLLCKLLQTASRCLLAMALIIDAPLHNAEAAHSVQHLLLVSEWFPDRQCCHYQRKSAWKTALTSTVAKQQVEFLPSGERIFLATVRSIALATAGLPVPVSAYFPAPYEHLTMMVSAPDRTTRGQGSAVRYRVLFPVPARHKFSTIQ